MLSSPKLNPKAFLAKMCSMGRLLRILGVKPFSVTAPSTGSKTPVPFGSHDTSQGLRNIVDDFKNSCHRRQFRKKLDAYNAVVHRLAELQAFPLIEEIIESQKQYKEISSEGFVIRLISLYGKAGMFDNALSLFDEMPSFNCPRTVKSFSALLNAAVNANRFDDALHLFRIIPSRCSIQPDLVSFNVAIRAFCQRGSLDEALAVVHEMEEQGFKPDRDTFNTLLGAFYEKRGFLEGEKFWAQKDFNPDGFGYSLRMGGMVRDGRITEAVKLVDEMKLNGVQPDVHCFNVLIKAFCDDGDVKGARYWYDELVRSQCAANRVTYATLVPFLLEKACFDVAFQLCKEAIAGSRRSRISAEVLKPVVEKFAAEGMMEQAKELVLLAKKKKSDIELPPNTSQSLHPFFNCEL